MWQDECCYLCIAALGDSRRSLYDYFMKTYFYTASSLDGFLATSEHSLDWLFAQDFAEDGPMSYTSFIRSIGALVMGSSTYRWLLDHQTTWEYDLPTWVFSHKEMRVPEGANIHLVQGNISDHFTDIVTSAEEYADNTPVETVGTVEQNTTQQGRRNNVWVMGGGDLAGQFADVGLLDEIWIQFAPVTLGSGQQLLPRKIQLQLLETAVNNDFVCTRYQVTRDGVEKWGQ